MNRAKGTVLAQKWEGMSVGWWRSRTNNMSSWLMVILCQHIYRDMYEWYEGRKAPAIWRDALANYVPLSMTASDLAKEHFAM